MITSAGASKPLVSYHVPVEDAESTQRGMRPARPVPQTQSVQEVQPQGSSVQGVGQASGQGLAPEALFSQDRFEEAGVAQALAQGAGLQLRQPQAGVPGPANDQNVGQASTDSRLNSPVFTRDEFESADVRRSGPVDLTGGSQEPQAVDDPTQAQELQTEQEDQARDAQGGEEEGGVKGKKGGKKDDKKKPQISRTTERTKVGSSPDAQVTVERDFIEIKTEDGKTTKKLQAVRVKADSPQAARKAAEIEAMERRKLDPDATLGGGGTSAPATASLGEALGAAGGDAGSSLGGDFGGDLGGSLGGGDSGGGSVAQV